MAFGFPPQYTTDLYLDTFTPNEFLGVAVQVAQHLNWRMDHIGETGFIAFTNRGILQWNSRVSLTITTEKAVIKSKSIAGELFDLGKNKKMVEKFTNAFAEIRKTTNAAEASAQFEAIKPTLLDQMQDMGSRPIGDIAEKKTGTLSLFTPRTGYFITPLLIDINIFIWVMMVFTGTNWIQPDNASLLNWGANTRPYTLDGQWWRLITNCFLHIGIFHLLLNMYALLFIGLLLEPRLGKAKFATAYFSTCITASVASLWWHDASISAGASGAIFGMYGVFLALLTSDLIEKRERKPLLISIGIFVVYNLINGLKGGVDNAAHIGGLAGGILFGYALLPGLKKPQTRAGNNLITGIIAGLLLGISILVYKSIPRDMVIYEKKIEVFVSNEQKALNIYKLPAETPKEILMASIKDTGIYYWNQEIAILDTLGQLRLPEKIQERNKKLRAYCNLRLQIYDLQYKSLLENSPVYDNQIKDLNNQLKDLMGNLTGKHPKKDEQ